MLTIGALIKLSAQSPQVGFNNNVRYRGKVFHIQTEDSGVKRPHVTTVLFADGGRSIHSERTDYSELLGQEGLVERVRQCMKAQHKRVFIALRDGSLDEAIDNLVNEVPSARWVGSAGARVASPGPLGTDESRKASAVTSSEPLASARVVGVDGPVSVRDVQAQGGSPQTVLASQSSTAAAGDALLPNRSRAGRPSAQYATNPEALFVRDSREQSLDEVILSYISEDVEPPGTVS